MTEPWATTPLPDRDWDATLSRIKDEMSGRPLAVHAVLARHPDLLAAWWGLRRHAVTGGTLGPRLGELVILRTAVLLRAWYEWASHVVRAGEAGLSADEIARVVDGPAASGWPEEEAALLAAVDDLFERRGLSAETQARLQAHFSLDQVLDLMAIHGMYMFLGGILNSWKVPLDDHVADRLPDDVTEAGFRSLIARLDADS